MYEEYRTQSLEIVLMHSLETGLWCALSYHRFVGPVFPQRQSATTKFYQEIIMPFVALLEADERNWCVHQDELTV